MTVSTKDDEECYPDDVSVPLNDASEQDSDDGSEQEDESLGQSQRDEVKEVEKLAQRETRNVQVWRRWVLFLIFATGGALSYMTYNFLSSEEEDNHTDAVCCAFCRQF